MSGSLLAQCCNLIPSKLDLQLEALLSLAADQQWEAMPLCTWINPEQRRRDGSGFRSQRRALSVQKQYRPHLRRRCYWTFIYHRLLGLQFHFLPDRGDRRIFRLSWEAAAKRSGSACMYWVAQAHRHTLLASEQLHRPEQKGWCTKASCRLLYHWRDCITHFNILTSLSSKWVVQCWLTWKIITFWTTSSFLEAL